MTVYLRILGEPSPQGSKTAIVRGGHARLIEGGSSTGRRKHKAWRQAVAAEAEERVWLHGPMPDGPLRVECVFRMPKPQSRPKYVRWCDRKPDLDKLIRSTLDGLADGGLLAHGDSRVASLTVSKVYVVDEWTGAAVQVDALEHVSAGLDVPVLPLADAEVQF